MFPLAGASVYEHISKNGAVTIAKDPGRDVTHTLTHSHVHDAHTFTNLTPSPCTHLHQPHTFTMHTPSPTSHLHHAHTFTMHTPSPTLCTITCLPDLHLPTHYLTHSHVHLPHTFTPLTTSLSHSTLTHMFTCLTPSHHHSLTKSTHVYTPSHISPRSRSESTEDLLTRRPQKWRDCHLLHTECKRPLVGKNLRGNTVYTHGSTWYFNENQHISAIYNNTEQTLIQTSPHSLFSRRNLDFCQ